MTDHPRRNDNGDLIDEAGNVIQQDPRNVNNKPDGSGDKKPEGDSNESSSTSDQG